MCFCDLYVTTTCFFASSTLKIGGGGGSFNCLYKAKKSIFDKKNGHFWPVFMKNGIFWWVRML